MSKKPALKYEKNHEFTISEANQLDYAYFPLTNSTTMKCSIDVNLNGDIKTDQNHYAMLPVTEDALKNTNYGRNIYFNINGELFSLNNTSPINKLEPDEVSASGGFLYYRVSRKNKYFKSVSTTYCPYGFDNVELTKVTFTNVSDKPLEVKSVVSIPLYCRSADTIRDHRHVTSLLNRVTIVNDGIINNPTLLFDEKAHLAGDMTYGVYARCNRARIKNFWPTIESLTPNGSDLSYPYAVVKDLSSPYAIGDEISGFEVLGGIEFTRITVLPQESFDIIFMITIAPTEKLNKQLRDKYLDFGSFDANLDFTKSKWDDHLYVLDLNLGDAKFSSWLKWVELQPILRRIFGCSFLPHHDYGKGGKGWRDLWQDCLALLYMNPFEVRDILLNNFIGVRIDGSNATIIGNKSGEFLADRNSITRVWSDHGVWPFFTVEKYIHMSGDIDFLKVKQVFFKDKFSHYTKKSSSFEGTSVVLDKKGNVYLGTILEHLLVQNLVAFYNVGTKGNLRLENADWNDGLDMAVQNGESVAFTSFYGANLVKLGTMIKQTQLKGLSVFKELNILLINEKFDVTSKQEILKQYFGAVEHQVDGGQIKYTADALGDILIKFGKSFKDQVRKNEWLEKGSEGYFNGYYDNDLKRLDSIPARNMTLTGQVFPLLSHCATESQINKLIKSVDEHLYDAKVGGYKLNTDFNEVKFNMGRLFGFAYGHKENGAMFSHMAIMYANGLYSNDKVLAGDKVIRSIYSQLQNINEAKIYPGIPEYINPKGRGMYHYLTGSASWLILTMVEEVFGIKRQYGQLRFIPRLMKTDFIKNTATIRTLIRDSIVTISYVNEHKLDYGEYTIKEIYVDDILTPFTRDKEAVDLKLATYFIRTIKIVLNN